jgi:hypothetical protein
MHEPDEIFARFEVAPAKVELPVCVEIGRTA